MKRCKKLVSTLQEVTCGDVLAFVAKLCDKCRKGFWQMSQRCATFAKTSAQRGLHSDKAGFLQHFIVGAASSLCQKEKRYSVHPRALYLLIKFLAKGAAGTQHLL